ncbi:Retrovirus-related Pol poly from transposon [Paramuricea clavata]|uniref:Retrovirus-related Pol poly from transposon n=1 Tax=Paramuricea clavata TaxID=317549 RepID=A0A6S7H5Q4_PARCT|nr:Retrovirus-related Pol poly from transposon [Paramuricea clavata]
MPVLQCNASMNGLGACLLQNNQPVAYASRSLTPTEMQYAQIEKEMLVIVFGMERFESYLYGRNVKVESDHKPLESILKKSLLKHTEADSHLQALVRIVKKGWPGTLAEVSPELRVYHPFRDELTVQNGVIFKGERLIVPEGLRTELKGKLHYNHGGVHATLRRAMEVFYWPGMNKDIEDVIPKCNVCAQYGATNQKEPLMSSPVPTHTWESIATDLFELRNKDYLVTVDYYSNFIEVDRLYSKKSTEVIQKLKAHMARCGVPERVVSDNGPEYSSSEFQDFAAQYEFEHVTSSPRYPQSNWKAESAVKTARRIIMKALDSKADPYLATLEHRNTPSAQRLFGRRTRSTIPTSRKLLEPTCMHSTKQELQQAKTKQAYYYNKVSKKLPTRKVGDAVRMMPEKGKKSWRKGKVKKLLVRGRILLQLMMEETIEEIAGIFGKLWNETI